MITQLGNVRLILCATACVIFSIAPVLSASCDGTSRSSLRVNGVSTSADKPAEAVTGNLGGGDLVRTAPIHTLSSNGSDFSMMLLPGSDSKFTLTSVHGNPDFFPADMVGEAYVRVIYAGEVFTSGEPIRFQLEGSASNFPPPGQFTLLVAEDATFTGPGGELVIEAGSTVTMN